MPSVITTKIKNIDTASLLIEDPPDGSAAAAATTGKTVIRPATNTLIGRTANGEILFIFGTRVIGVIQQPRATE